MAIREVVTSHANQYGSDLLPLLSDLINQAEGEEGATAASLALEGIAVLCKEGVIDMRTTVKVNPLYSATNNNKNCRYLLPNAVLT